MKVLDRIHQRYVHERRVEVLANAVAELVPPNARVLDIGCGDGLLSKRIQAKRRDIQVTGVDVLVRPMTHIPVTPFDGRHLPYKDSAVDVALFVDVLHHTTDPTCLLREAKRVAKDCLIIKDHTKNGLLAGPTLTFMDWVGNAHHGVALPFNYWPEKRWREEFQDMGLTISHWKNRLALYPWWDTWLFDRSLHFVARLTIHAT